MKFRQNKVVLNASWIIGCKVVQAILVLVTSMLTARYLGPANYGLLNYASSLVAFVVPIMQLGFDSILVKEIIEARYKEGIILGTAVSLSFISSVLCLLGIISVSSILNAGDKATIIIVGLYGLQLLFQSLELIQYWFQAKLLSKYTSITMLVAYVVVSAYKVFLFITKKSVYWFAIANAFDFCIISFILLFLYRRLGGEKFGLSWKAAKSMLSNGKFYIISNLMITVFTQTDRVMLKLMINDSATGYYSAAVTCATMTNFVFSAIIDSARPSIFEGKKRSEETFEKRIILLYFVVIYLALFQSLVMTIFAKIIVMVMYGEQYLDSVSILQIIVWYTIFSYMGSVRSIWILGENKYKYLLPINIGSVTLNIVLNLILIRRMGVCGAALATVITQFVSNIVMNVIISPLRHNNRLVLLGLNPLLIHEFLG